MLTFSILSYAPPTLMLLDDETSSSDLSAFKLSCRFPFFSTNPSTISVFLAYLVNASTLGAFVMPSPPDFPLFSLTFLH